jgi:hypothetical protein
VPEGEASAEEVRESDGEDCNLVFTSPPVVCSLSVSRLRVRFEHTHTHAHTTHDHQARTDTHIHTRTHKLGAELFSVAGTGLEDVLVCT